MQMRYETYMEILDKELGLEASEAAAKMSFAELAKRGKELELYKDEEKQKQKVIKLKRSISPELNTSQDNSKKPNLLQRLLGGSLKNKSIKQNLRAGIGALIMRAKAEDDKVHEKIGEMLGKSTEQVVTAESPV
jgi:hypothetical protein